MAKVVDLNNFKLNDAWSESDPTLQTRDAWVLSWNDGAVASSAVLFEVMPGSHLGRHIHSAEEVIVVLEGTIEWECGGERERTEAQSLVVAPPLVPHNVHNVGDGVARLVGFFPASSVVSVYDDLVMPANKRTGGTPIPTPEDVRIPSVAGKVERPRP